MTNDTNASRSGGADHRTGPTTARLFLRQMVPDDAEAFFRIQSDPEVMRYTHETPPESVEQLRGFLADYPDFDTVGYGRWGCYLRESGELIGFSGLKYMADLGATDLGYRLLPKYWGQGLATEAGRASLRYGFETIGLERIAGFVLPANAGSIRVLEKVGMERDGTVEIDGLEAQRFRIDRERWERSAALGSD
ncbi:Spermidine N(1)-acetyltransferase [Planctomycetes bacterium Pla163]|uniref:Spermidine N(1)-acetyltransferase n=1 Tax=Rohdeia mirabilis TaxID=2528008 RepID=A0A518CX23_9BACT|nr:Spermidine N(1)-acetyltransferase [Planctomycetes bacterium Pla163]